MHHLMLVESDEDLRQKLTERLQEEVSKVKVHGFEDSAAALEALDTLKPLTLIVTSAHEADVIDGFQLVLRAREKAPRARIIVHADKDEVSLAKLSKHSVGRYIARTTLEDDLCEMTQAIINGDDDIAGVLDDLELLDVVTLACAAQRTATLHVRQGERRGRIVFDSGKLAHAEHNDHVGTEALFELLALQQGDIFLQSKTEDYTPSISTPWLEALVGGIESLPERRERHSLDDDDAPASITDNDVELLLGMSDADIEIEETNGQAFFSEEELADLGELEIPADSAPLSTPGMLSADASQSSSSVWMDNSEPLQVDLAMPQSAAEHGAAANPGSGRRFARVPSSIHGLPDVDPAASWPTPNTGGHPVVHNVTHGPLTASAHPARLRSLRDTVASLDEATFEAADDARTATISAALQQMLATLQAELPEMVAADVLHSAEGMSVASIKTLDSYDSNTAAAFYGELIHQCLKGIDHFGLPPSLEDIQITTDAHYILMRAVRGTPFTFMVLMGRQGNLGVARVTMRRVEPRLAQLLPQ